MAKNPRKVQVCAAALVLLLHFVTQAGAQSSEGIKVHGHWAIEVRNPDGTLASRTEFDNALLTSPPTGFGGSSGSSLLARLLAGDFNPGTTPHWFVNLAESAGNLLGPCRTPTVSVGVLCQAAAQVAVLPNSTVTLTGQVAASDVAGGSVGFVFTRLAAPVGPGFAFTGHTLPAPIAVAAGQVIQFTVTFSFS